MSAETPQRILVVQTAFLGDIVLVSPLLEALRAKYPGARVALLTTPVGRDLFQGSPLVDEVIVFDKRRTERGLRATWALAGRLRQKGFDLAVCPHRSVRTALITALARIPRRIGFSDSALPWFYHAQVARDRGRHEVWRNLQLLDPLGGLPPGFTPVLNLSSPPEFDPRRLGITGNGVRVGLCPGSIWPTKRWPPAGYARLADLLQERFQAAVFLLGAPEDQAVAAEVEALCRRPVINLAGRTSVPELVGVIERMDALVANDSAPVHIASARQVPVVAIFGPTVPAQGFAPLFPRSAVVELPLACRPCSAHGPRTCPLGHFRCMREIQAEQVLAALEPFLSRP